MTAHSTGQDADVDAADSYDPTDGILVVDGLKKKFGGLTAVDDLSFAVQENEILGFIGPNGAGKSTTFNCVTSTYPVTGGHVYFQGDEITDKPAYEIVNAGIGRTFQSFRPLGDRTIVENVELPLTSGKLLSLSGLRGDTRKKALAICGRVGLDDRIDQTPDELPHAGMVRLEIARALATDPELVLIDEPFAGLTNTEINELSELFTDLRDDGLTLVIVDHNMRGLLTLVDRAFVINFGSKIAEGTPDEIRNDPAVQKAYLGEE